jgi:hypothetical protein
MIDALKTLFENDVVSQEVRAQIEEAWEAKIKENRLAATAQLREEFAQKYEHDKSVMVEAIDTLISGRLAEEIAEFHEDRKQLAETKAKLVIAMRENSNLLKNFVQEQLKREIHELRADKRAMESKYSNLEEFVVEALASEIAEFHEDKQDLAETKVRLVREAKAHINKVKNNFIERGAKLVSETVDKGLTAEINQLKEDINTARKNDFGRKIFEAFTNEYMTSHLNEKSETKKLLKVLSIKDRQLSEAKTLAIKAKRLAESKNQEVKRLNESVKRQKIMNELIAPLGKEQRSIMIDLLESVQTDRLRSAFDKYIPSVIDGNTPAKKKAILSEATEITGNREKSQTTNSSIAGGDVIDIKRLAGLN